MGARKRLRSEKTKEARKSEFGAKLMNCPTSPRKMRLVAEMIREKRWKWRFICWSILRNRPPAG